MFCQYCIISYIARTIRIRKNGTTSMRNMCKCRIHLNEDWTSSEYSNIWLQFREHMNIHMFTSYFSWHFNPRCALFAIWMYYILCDNYSLYGNNGSITIIFNMNNPKETHSSYTHTHTHTDRCESPNSIIILWTQFVFLSTKWYLWHSHNVYEN